MSPLFPPGRGRTAPTERETHQACESVLLANDPRPPCPHCGGHRIQRRDKQPNGKRRWSCVDCNRRFIADDSAAFVDHRKVEHFDPDDSVDEEAKALFKLYENDECDADEIRELIRVSEGERHCLEFLAQAGMLASANVEAMLSFRDRVLGKFNNLVDAELAVLTCPDSSGAERQAIREAESVERLKKLAEIRSGG